MEEVDAILRRLEHENVAAIRNDIANLIKVCLDRVSPFARLLGKVTSRQRHCCARVEH